MKEHLLRQFRTLNRIYGIEDEADGGNANYVSKYWRLVEVGYPGCCKEQRNICQHGHEQVEIKHRIKVKIISIVLLNQCTSKSTIHQHAGHSEENSRQRNRPIILWRQYTRKNHPNDKTDNLCGQLFHQGPHRPLGDFGF